MAGLMDDWMYGCMSESMERQTDRMIDIDRYSKFKKANMLKNSMVEENYDDKCDKAFKTL